MQQLALACYGSSSRSNAEDLDNEWAATEWLQLLLRWDLQRHSWIPEVSLVSYRLDTDRGRRNGAKSRAQLTLHHGSRSCETHRAVESLRVCISHRNPCFFFSWDHPDDFCSLSIFFHRDSASLGWYVLLAKRQSFYGVIKSVFGFFCRGRTVAAVMFAVRVVTADYYLASPVKDLDVCYSEFRESNVKKVPVVRIFGATPAGQFDVFVFACMWLFLPKGNLDCGAQTSVLTHRLVFAAVLRLNVELEPHVRHSTGPFSFVLASTILCGDCGGNSWLHGLHYMWHAAPPPWFYFTEMANYGVVTTHDVSSYLSVVSRPRWQDNVNLFIALHLTSWMYFAKARCLH